LINLNRSFAPRCPLGRFITFFYGLLDGATGVLSYSNAGHNYPLLVRADGTVEQLSESGLVLGIFPSTQYDLRNTKLERGDTLALFSDGVTEACTVEGTEFGETGLAEFLKARRSQPCSTMVDALVSHVRGWSGGSAFADDFTVVLLRRL
jgi:phosphoserine phosphatase RsbU/P